MFEVFRFGDHLASHNGILWIFRFGSGKEGLEREESSLDAEDWSPALFEGIEANGSLQDTVSDEVLCGLKRYVLFGC